MCGWMGYGGLIEDVTIHYCYFHQPKEHLPPPLHTLAHKRIVDRKLICSIDPVHGMVVAVHHNWLYLCCPP